jgi:DNA mismatch endonuclease, patch repair protein
MDTVDRKTRSRIMASVGRSDTGPEMRLRRILHERGLRYRLRDRKLPGSPDIIFPRFKSVIFVYGCFWHRHSCKYSTTPSSNKDFWSTKFKDNQERDSRNIKALKKSGWRVLIVWECEIKYMTGSVLHERVYKFLMGSRLCLYSSVKM